MSKDVSGTNWFDLDLRGFRTGSPSFPCLRYPVLMHLFLSS